MTLFLNFCFPVVLVIHFVGLKSSVSVSLKSAPNGNKTISSKRFPSVHHTNEKHYDLNNTAKVIVLSTLNSNKRNPIVLHNSNDSKRAFHRSPMARPVLMFTNGDSVRNRPSPTITKLELPHDEFKTADSTTTNVLNHELKNKTLTNTTIQCRAQANKRLISKNSMASNVPDSCHCVSIAGVVCANSTISTVALAQPAASAVVMTVAALGDQSPTSLLRNHFLGPKAGYLSKQSWPSMWLQYSIKSIRHKAAAFQTQLGFNSYELLNCMHLVLRFVKLFFERIISQWPYGGNTDILSIMHGQYSPELEKRLQRCEQRKAHLDRDSIESFLQSLK